MAIDPLPRARFEGYVQEHEQDPFAHASLVDRLARGDLRFRTETDGRLTTLERWQQRIIGGLGVFTLFLAGGGVTLVIEFVRHP